MTSKYNVPSVEDLLSLSPGMVIRIDHGENNIYSLAVGVQCINTCKTMTENVSFRVGSITKSFIGYTVLQLINDNLITPNSTVMEMLPQYNLQPDITIQNLLHHTSGISDFLHHLDSGISLDDMVRKCSKLLYPVGTGWNYSNTNYFLLGKVIEYVTKMNLPDVYDKMIIKPFHLTNTTVNKSDSLTCGYIFDNGAYVDQSQKDIPYAFGCGDVVSNAKDISIFIRNYMKMADSIPTALSPKGQYGYGFGILENEWYGHGGEIDGYNSFAYYNPTTDATVVVLSNTNNDRPAANVGQMIINV